MKIDTIIIDQEQAANVHLKKCLLAKFPEIIIMGEAATCPEAINLIESLKPSLVFVNMGASLRFDPLRPLLRKKTRTFETIFMSDHLQDAVSAIRQDACDFLLKPFNISDIVISVSNAIRKLSEKKTTMNGATAINGTVLPHTKLIGIPTIEAMEFLYAHEIIRCEGLQKCTNVLSTHESNTVSSYNIGEFRKLLDPYGFFLSHKSHLINLMHVRRLTREGFIVLSDNSYVPLARRKRAEFLHALKHL